MHSTACSIIIKEIKGVYIMSTLHHEELLETCMEQAIENFCESNRLTPDMFALIEDHLGVQIALERSAQRLFDDLCQ